MGFLFKHRSDGMGHRVTLFIEKHQSVGKFLPVINPLINLFKYLTLPKRGIYFICLFFILIKQVFLNIHMVKRFLRLPTRPLFLQDFLL